jgi:predicted aldo/keto reductase-like oxidoreductase
MRTWRTKERLLLDSGVGPARPSVDGMPSSRLSDALLMSPSQGMPQVRLPRSGFVMPKLGLGCYNLIGEELERQATTLAAYRHAFTLGLRYFDTAPNYRTEAVLQAALAGARQQCYLVTKTFARDAQRARQHVEFSLRKLGTEWVDCVHLHSATNYDDAMRAREGLDRLRAEGKVRQIGISCHVAFPLLRRLIMTGAFDDILVARCYFPIGRTYLLSPELIEAREQAVAEAQARGMTIIGMKALGNMVFGHNAKNLVPNFGEERLAALPGAAIRWAVSDTRFHAFNIGIASAVDVDANVATFSADLRCTDADRDLLADFTARLWETSFPGELREADGRPDVMPL